MDNKIIEQKENTVVKVGWDTKQGWELMKAQATILATSDIIPDTYKKKPGNCLIAIELAMRINASPLMVMQNLYIVYGKPSFSSQFLISTFNACGRFSSLKYEFFGEKGKDSWGCRAVAYEKATGEKLEGAEITIDIAKKENWYQKDGSKWKTMPQQMLMYRAASWFVRAYAPELSMGLQTYEEVQDMTIDMPNITVEEEIKQNANGELLDLQTNEQIDLAPEAQELQPDF